MSPGGARPPSEMMVAFIDAHREAYGVESICAVLPIAPSVHDERTSREHAPERRPARVRRDEALAVDVERVWRQHQAVTIRPSGISVRGPSSASAHNNGRQHNPGVHQTG